MMLKPHPRVRVLTWSPVMRLKRRHEVQIIETVRGDIEEEVAIARFATREAADEFAATLRDALPNKGKGIQ